MRGLREFVQFLEREHPEEIVRITKEIDPKECEHAAFEEYFLQKGKYPLLVFENVKTMGGNRWEGLYTIDPTNSSRRLAIAYGLDVNNSTLFDVVLKHQEAMQHPEKPLVVDKDLAPVKEVVYTGDEANLDMLPYWRNCVKDSRPGWITPKWIVRKIDTGRYNISWQRSHYVNSKRTTARFFPGRHIYEYFKEYKEAGKPMPAVAVIGGHHPSFYAAATTKFSWDVDEYDA